jgi:hypothetical protein
MTESIDPADTVSYDDVRDQPERERDGVASLHDAEGEQGDEDEVVDRMDLDQTAAEEADVELDRIGGETPRLD